MTDETSDAAPAVVTAARALAAPMSIDAEARTVDVIWSTGARAPNWVPPLGQIMEELDMSGNAVRMTRLASGQAPLLDSHSHYSASSVIGRVLSASVSGGRGVAKIQISRAPDVEPIWRRLEEGTLRNVSVGYRVFRYEPIQADGQTIHRAVDWEPYEISLVAVPVDAAAGVRGEASAVRATALEPDILAEAPPVPEITESVMTTENHAADSVPAVDASRAAQDAIQAERSRMASLTPVVTAARGRVPQQALDDLHVRAQSEGWTAEALRAALWDAAVASAQPASTPAAPAVQVGTSGDDPARIIDAMATAIAVRSMPEFRAPTGNDHWRQFASLSPKHMLMELAIARGERVAPRDMPRLIERAFHTTSDFPMLLENAGNKMLMAGYELAAPSFRRVFRQVAFNDFKQHSFLGVGDFPGLLPLGEGGEIKSGTISERRERLTPAAYGRNISVTQQMLINDDLGAFTNFGSMIGQRVAQDENGLAYAVINTASGDGPTLAEGSAAVFTTGRGNKASSGTTIDVTNLAAARAAIMKQKTLDGLPIAIGSQMLLVVGPDRELLARQITATFTASQTSAVNPYAGFIDVVVEPLITGNRWYLFAAGTRPYAFGYVNGQTAPRISVYSPVQGRDALQIDVVLYFGAGATDWRGGYFNPGN